MGPEGNKENADYIQYLTNHNWFLADDNNYRTNMLHLPPYKDVKELEGKGNFAVDAYYKFPQMLFYRHKLHMILDMMGKGIYHKVLDFGCGKARIFEKELLRHSISVKSVDIEDVINPKWKFDLIICSSVLEFCNLNHTLNMLNGILSPVGIIIIASPMDTTLSYLYYKIIGDKKQRHNHNHIVESVSKVFHIIEYKSWLGLYFCMKVRKK